MLACNATGQGLGSQLNVGIDYFNTFSRSNSTDVQEIEVDEINLGIKLSTNVYKGLDFGLSMDVYSLWNDQAFLKRAYFYGTFVEYNFLTKVNRFDVSAALTLRASKYRHLYEYPFYENADWSLYTGLRMKFGYQVFKKYPRIKPYGGIHFSFPTFRHSLWYKFSGNYGNINWMFFGISYTIGNQNNND